MKKNEISKKDILRLIKTDLMITKIISAQQSIGFDPTDFDIYIDDVIFKLIGINNYDLRLDDFMDEHMQIVWRVKEINVIENPEQLESLSIEVYRNLRNMKRKLDRE